MNENNFFESFSFNSHLNKKLPNVPSRKTVKFKLKINFRPAAGVHGPHKRDGLTDNCIEHITVPCRRAYPVPCGSCIPSDQLILVNHRMY